MVDFNLVKGKLAIDPYTLTVSAFNDIWEYDKSKNKAKASNMLTYVFHYCDITQKNPFRNLPVGHKDQYARRNAFGNQNYKFKKEEQELIDRAIAWYEVLNKNSVLRMSMAIDIKLDQMTEFLLDEKNKITTSVQFEDQSKVLGQLEKILQSKKRTDDFVRNELEKTKIRGNAKLSPLDEGILD
jgi:hypothetical protein